MTHDIVAGTPVTVSALITQRSVDEIEDMVGDKKKRSCRGLGLPRMLAHIAVPVHMPCISYRLSHMSNGSLTGILGCFGGIPRKLAFTGMAAIRPKSGDHDTWVNARFFFF